MKTIDLTINPFKKLDGEWTLVSAGDKSGFNCMTISWGGFGVLWHKNVATIYIRPSRYTFKFLKKFDNFTISFYDEKYKKDLSVLGSLSGRDCNKLSQTQLTPKFLKDGVTFNEANLTLVCKKIYMQKFNPKQIPEEIKQQFYSGGITPHYMIIGEIIKKI